MILSRTDIVKRLADWNQAWARHDLTGVMRLFHDDILFENWTGAKIQGKENLSRAWRPWFENHNGFHFSGEDTFIDVEQQKVLYRGNSNGHLWNPALRANEKSGVESMSFILWRAG
jgi:uncharacterized protein (TIGR02246 family)